MSTPKTSPLAERIDRLSGISAELISEGLGQLKEWAL
jgi:hypothetical protein